MPSFFKFLPLFICLLFGNTPFIWAQAPVSKTVAWLDSALARRETPILSAPQNNPAGFEAYLSRWSDLSRINYAESVSSIMDIVGVVASNTVEQKKQLVSLIKEETNPIYEGILIPDRDLALPPFGNYCVVTLYKEAKIVLAYGEDQQYLDAASQVLVIEQTPFWIHVTNGTPVDPLWKKDALSIVAYLALASGLVSPADIPLEPSRWMSVLSSLEENPFFSAELADIRPSAIPATHPLVHELAHQLDQYAREHAPSFETAQQEAVPSTTSGASYFSLQDMQKHYDSPLISDVATELRSAGKRIERGEEQRLNTAAIVGGLTDFAIERAKEEFSVAFLERMRQSLDGNKKGGFQELCVLLPQTCSFFTGQQQLTGFKSLLPTARQSFLKDLQTLGTQVQELLSISPYDTLKHNKDIYNLALFYDIASMAYQGMPLDTLLGNVASRLNHRQEQLFLQGNLDLVTKDKAKTDLKKLNDFISVLITDLGWLQGEILSKGSFIDLILFDNRSIVGIQDFTELYTEEITYRNQQLFSWVLKDQYDQFVNIPRQLEGQRYYEHLIPNLDQYSYYFGQAPDPIQLAASGVELSRKLVNPPPGEQSMPEFMVEYYRYLQGVEQSIREKTALFRASSPTALQARKRSLETKRSALEQQLDMDIAFWNSQKDRRLEDHIAALTFLKGALDPANDPSWKIAGDLSDAASIDSLLRYEERLKTAEKWARERMETIRKAGDINHPMPPALQWQDPAEVATPASTEEERRLKETEERLNRIRAISRDIDSLLFRMDATYIPQINTSRNQALLLYNIAEMSQNLLSCLKVSPPGAPVEYIKPTEFWALMRDDRSRNLFLGLVQQRVQRVSANSRLSARNVAVVTSRFVDIAYQADLLLDSLRNLPRAERRFSDYLPLTGMGVELLSTIVENPLILNDPGNRFAEEQAKALTSFPRVTGHAFSLFNDLQAERYGSAVQNLVNMLAIVAESSPVQNNWQNVGKELLFYGSFMGEVAAARNAEDMKGALLAAALPPGSSRLKREEPFNVGLNTYLGIGGGFETLNNAKNLNKTAGTIGLSLPVGLSISWKFSKKHQMSYSLLCSVLDLGAVAAFRLGDPQSEVLPDLKIENFVAPGAYFLLNIPRSPFSLGVGSQYGPRVRSITGTNGTQTQSSAWRWGAFVGMDVPIFSFSTMRTR